MMHPEIQETVKDIKDYLWTFEWAYPNGEPRGEVVVNTRMGVPRLLLTVYTADNDDPDDREVKALAVTRSIRPYVPAAVQVRDIIHWFLTHEADEQMFSDGVRIFDPHCRPGQDKKVDGTYIRSEHDRAAVQKRRQEVGL
jgi:hypothetical protein